MIGSANNKVKRLWARDASLWTNSDESKWLGWLGITEDQRSNVDRFQADRRGNRFRAVLRTPCFSAWAARACASKS